MNIRRTVVRWSVRAAVGHSLRPAVFVQLYVAPHQSQSMFHLSSGTVQTRICLAVFPLSTIIMEVRDDNTYYLQPNNIVDIVWHRGGRGGLESFRPAAVATVSICSSYLLVTGWSRALWLTARQLALIKRSSVIFINRALVQYGAAVRPPTNASRPQSCSSDVIDYQQRADSCTSRDAEMDIRQTRRMVTIALNVSPKTGHDWMK